MGRGKYDKTARLLRIISLLNENPDGMSASELAADCEVNIRTLYRDLAALDRHMKVGIWQDEGRWGLLPGQFLPPISFTVPEVMTIFMASRLLLGYINANNPNIASTFAKLNIVVPSPLKEQIAMTMEWMKKQKTDERFCRNLELLSRAWVDRRRVRIRYWTLGKQPATRVIEPYFIQPAAWEHANYVIAYCHSARGIRTFKIERMESVQLLNEKYDVPSSFDANRYLGSALGITTSGKEETVKLKFSPEIGRVAQETRWHPSQVTQVQPDGSALVTFTVCITPQVESFVLGWGKNVEVLEPEKLRTKIAATAHEVSKVYDSVQL